VAKARSSVQGGTRARLLALLCKGARTTSELARELGMSANGVRGHLDLLERDGLVTHAVLRQAVGKPAHEYRLTAEGSLHLSGAYLPLLSVLLTVMTEQDRGVGPEALLREAGRRLARGRPGPGSAVRNRAAAALGLLQQLGAIGELRTEQGAVWIEGSCCPLRALVPEHPLACRAVEAMLEEYIGGTVTEQCDKGDPPACRFYIGAAD
jgi:predicted ArsR family transcriptional regulator